MCTAARTVEIVKAAEEFAAFGEHGDGACAALLVLAGQRGRVRDVGQVALGRRRALDLGDHGDAVGALKPSCRVNRSRGRQRGLLHILKRYGELTGALILQRSRHQFVQNRHGPPFVGVRSCATLGHVLSRLPNPSYILGFRRRFRLRQNIGINWHACADVLRSTWNGRRGWTAPSTEHPCSPACGTQALRYPAACNFMRSPRCRRRQTPDSAVGFDRRPCACFDGTSLTRDRH